MLVRAFLSEAFDLVADAAAREALDSALTRWWEQEAA